jgi:hypothetical protein
VALLEQIFSDFSGVVFGGTVEAAAGRMGLPVHGLDSVQQSLPMAKRWQTLGAACGVVIGCLLGMTQMLFMDLKREDQVKEFEQVNRMLAELMKDDSAELNAHRSSLYLVDPDKQNIWTVTQTTGSNGQDETVYVEMSWTKGISGYCARTGQPFRIDDAYDCDFFNAEFDRASNGKRRTRSVLCVPVLDRSTGKAFAVMQFINKMRDGEVVGFTAEDEQNALQMAHYLSILRPAVQTVIDSHS